MDKELLYIRWYESRDVTMLTTMYESIAERMHGLDALYIDPCHIHIATASGGACPTSHRSNFKKGNGTTLDDGS